MIGCFVLRSKSACGQHIRPMEMLLQFRTLWRSYYFRFENQIY